jgi:hypothetical protein
MFKFTLALTTLLLGVTTSVRGHGYVQEITLGSTKYTGYLPFSDPYADLLSHSSGSMTTNLLQGIIIPLSKGSCDKSLEMVCGSNSSPILFDNLPCNPGPVEDLSLIEYVLGERWTQMASDI